MSENIHEAVESSVDKWHAVFAAKQMDSRELVLENAVDAAGERVSDDEFESFDELIALAARYYDRQYR